MSDDIVFYLRELLEEVRAIRAHLAQPVAAPVVTPAPPPPAAPAVTPAPPPPAAPAVTLDELRTLFHRASRAGHRDALRATLELHNAEKLPDVNPADYQKLAKYVRGLLDE